MKTFKISIELNACVLMAFSLPLCVEAVAGKAKTGGPIPSTVEPSSYVGVDTCKTCHEPIYKSFEATPHWKTVIGRHEGGAKGCEACHRPGKEHVEGGGDTSKIFRFAGADPKEASQRCLACHEYGAEHANFSRSEHSLNGVSCVACHSPHHAKEAQYLLVQKQPGLCFSCHTEAKQDFQRPFRHRVEQGLVQCS